jgi:hypothetical protein
VELLIAIELIIGVIFVIVFGPENLRQDLSRRFYQRPLYPNDDDCGDEIRRRPSHSPMLNASKTYGYSPEGQED